MALADSNIDVKELEMLCRIGDEKGISQAEINTLLLSGEKSSIHLPETITEKIGYLYDLSLVAWADGILHDKERELVKLFCAKFGFRSENIAGICDFLLEEAHKNTPKHQILSIVSQNI